MVKQTRALLKLALPAASRFRDLPPGSRVRLYCAIYDYEREAVLQFPKDVLRGLADIGAEIDMDYYDLTEWPQDDE